MADLNKPAEHTVNTFLVVPWNSFPILYNWFLVRCKSFIDASKLEPYWHICPNDDGILIQKPKEFVTKVAPILKTTLTVLSVASRLARVIGINFTDEIVETATKLNNFTEKIIANNNIPSSGYTDNDGSNIPARLQGENLRYLRNLIGHKDNNDSIAVGSLYRTCITGPDSIVGRKGKFLWLCKEHHSLINEWNEGIIKDNNQLKEKAMKIGNKLKDINDEDQVKNTEIENINNDIDSNNDNNSKTDSNKKTKNNNNNNISEKNNSDQINNSSATNVVNSSSSINNNTGQKADTANNNSNNNNNSGGFSRFFSCCFGSSNAVHPSTK